MKEKPCEHLASIHAINLPDQYVCEECVTIGSEWLHLRTCQTCGQTLCCDSSPNQHASKHAETSGHPVAASAEPEERWLWCYVHNQLLEY